MKTTFLAGSSDYSSNQRGSERLCDKQDEYSVIKHSNLKYNYKSHKPATERFPRSNTKQDREPSSSSHISRTRAREMRLTVY